MSIMLSKMLLFIAFATRVSRVSDLSHNVYAGRTQLEYYAWPRLLRGFRENLSLPFRNEDSSLSLRNFALGGRLDSSLIPSSKCFL